MQPALLGKKIGMTQVYDDAGVLHGVTVVQAGPCTVLQIKVVEHEDKRKADGYHAIQLGFGEVKPHRARRPQIGHAAKAGVAPPQFLREVRLDQPDPDAVLGQVWTVEAFEGVEHVDITGTTKGKGYAGGMKRHGFKGQLASHGVERKHRSPGSIASHASNAGTGPKIKKGKRMAGHLGHVTATTRNHKLIGIDKDKHLLLIKGAVPGANGECVFVRKSKTAKSSQQ